MGPNDFERNDATAHAGQGPSGEDQDALVSGNDDELSGIVEPEVDEVELLRQQLDQANATLMQAQREAAEVKGKYTTLEQQHGTLQGIVAETIKDQKRPTTSKRRQKRRVDPLPDILNDAGQFRTAIQQELDEVHGRLEEIPQGADEQLRDEVSSLNSAVQDITKALQALSQNQLYNDEQNQLIGMGYTNQEIQRLETTRAREGLPTLRSALGYEPDLMARSQNQPTSRRSRKRAKSANRQQGLNGNANNGQPNSNPSNRQAYNRDVYQPNVASVDQRIDTQAFGNELNNHEQNPNVGASAPSHDGNAREEIRQHLAAGTYYTLPAEEKRRLEIAAQKAAANDSWDSAY
jgi:chromosome segregation ATPase